MDKIAQERGILNKLREKTNISGKVLESINPEFKELMERLRALDAQIREDAKDIKPLMRAATSLTRRRDYLTAATNLSALHEKFRIIGLRLERFKQRTDMKHYEFLLNQFDDEHKEQLFKYDPDKQIELGDDGAVDDKVITASLKKQAGISDWWFKVTDPVTDIAHNLATQRGIAMRAYEKRFSISFLKQLKVACEAMVERTQSFVSFMLSIYKKFGAALATRKIGIYDELIQEYLKRFASFHKSFVEFYNKNVVPLKEQYEKMLEEQNKKLEADIAAKTQMPEPGPLGSPARPPSITPGGPVWSPPKVKPPTELKKTQFTPSEPKPIVPEEEEPFDLTKKKASLFLSQVDSITSASELVSSILKLSSDLEATDEIKSMQLLAIAEGIVEDYKKAGIFDIFKGKKEDEKPEQSVQPKPQEKETPPLA